MHPIYLAHCLQACQAITHIIGIYRCEYTITPGIHSLQQLHYLNPFALTNNDAFRSHVQRILHKFAHADLLSAFKINLPRFQCHYMPVIQF